MPSSTTVDKGKTSKDLKRKISNNRYFRRDKYHPNCIPNRDDGGENIKKITKSNDSSKQKSSDVTGCNKREVPVMKLISHDMIREIVIPREDRVPAVVFDSSRFGQLKDKSKVGYEYKLTLVISRKDKSFVLMNLTIGEDH